MFRFENGVTTALYWQIWRFVGGHKSILTACDKNSEVGEQLKISAASCIAQQKFAV